MSKDWSIRKRRPVRRKNIAPLLKELEKALKIDLSVDGAFLEMAEYGPWKMVFVDKIAKTVELNNDENERFVFLTLRGLLDYPDSAKWIEVDHGAIPFLMNGADCMGAGVQMADPAVTAGDLVWVRDEEHGKPLALGIAMVDGEEMVAMSKGKAINTLHWIGDDLWNLES